MIEINMNTQRLKMTIKGHATPEENGQYKEICAAVSAIAQSMVYCIGKLGHAEDAVKSIQYRPEPGDMFVLIIPEQWAETMIRHRFRNYGDGMELMAKSHPESVTMIWDGEKILPDKEDEKDE